MLHNMHNEFYQLIYLYRIAGALDGEIIALQIDPPTSQIPMHLRIK